VSEYRGLVIDFGGVLTTPLGDAFRAFCRREAVDYDRVRGALRAAYGADGDPESLVARFETGRMSTEAFEQVLAAALSEGLDHPIEARGLVARMVADLRIDDAMVDAVRRIRAAGVKTALLSNSWGVDYYPHDLLDGLFDEMVISGQVGLRKPHPEVFGLAARGLGLEPPECVFVDDLRSNVEAAEAAGMRGVVHQEAGGTIEALERTFEVPLRYEVMGGYLTPRQVNDRKDDLQLLDVREPFEWQEGRIEGAVHIPLQQVLDGQTEALDPSKPVLVYCRTANRSEVAKLMLEARGFDASIMEGGSEAWVAEGLPFTTPDGRPGRVA
jgi:epoxide hydrolase-like predicted phosphatase